MQTANSDAFEINEWGYANGKSAVHFGQNMAWNNGGSMVQTNSANPSWGMYMSTNLDEYRIWRMAPGASGNSVSTFLEVNSSGNFGIGTTTPSQKVDIYNPSTDTILNIGGAASSAAQGLSHVFFYNSAATVANSVLAGVTAQTSSTKDSGQILLRVTNGGTLNTAMVIKDSGNVGIGSTSPSATLDINGYAKLNINSSQPVACSAANTGSVALTSGFTICICKGSSTTWVKSIDGTTACVW